MHMRILAICGALALAACNTNPTPAPDVSAAMPTAPIDQKIAKVSADLAKNCALLKTGLILAETFNKSPKVAPVIKAAKVTADDFCAAPPTDTTTAIQLVTSAAIDVANALKETQ